MSSRPTKYASVVKDLPKYLGDDPGRLELLGKVRDEILATPASCMLDNNWNIDAQMLARLSDVKARVESVLALGKQLVGSRRDAAAFTAAYATTRIVVDTLGDLKSAAQLLLDAYERLMIEQMEVEGMRSLHLESGASVTTFEEPCGKVVDKAAFRQWCIDNGYAGQLQLWPSTMNAVVKERALNAEPAPDGVEVYAKTMVRLNRG
jgi:hypothetical protein